MKRHLLGFTAIIAASFLAAPVLAASVPVGLSPAAQSNVDDGTVLVAASPTQILTEAGSQFHIFTPKAQTNPSVIDYSVWDSALENIVLRMGQSIRKREGRPSAQVGTRVVMGHKSAYRLEGSRVTFSYLNDDYKTGLTEYRKDLERIANDVDITTLSRDEQLAFWYNLHNVTLIEQIALHYPVRQPSKLRVGPNKELLDEAKLLTIRGVALSLRDIRENIVYVNWRNPKVMYGFFRGNIGGPALQNYAMTSNNVTYVLDLQADEFVNSLRGFHESRSALKVSTLYEEARPYYFNNWPADLKAHLRAHASPDVLEELAVDKPVVFDRYDPVVADLQAGDTPRTAKLNVTINGSAQTARISPEVARLLNELETKTDIMKKRGMIKQRTGTVTIEDFETIDVDIPETE